MLVVAVAPAPPRADAVVPSRRVLASPEAELLAARRDHSADAWAHALRGDLDGIVLKALEPDPARRYASAAELAEDIERFRTHRPVIARRLTTLYRLRKFARRHRVSSALVAVAAVALVVGVAFTLREYARAERELHRLEILADATRLEELFDNVERLWMLEPWNRNVLHIWLVGDVLALRDRLPKYRAARTRRNEAAPQFEDWGVMFQIPLQRDPIFESRVEQLVNELELLFPRDPAISGLYEFLRRRVEAADAAVAAGADEKAFRQRIESASHDPTRVPPPFGFEIGVPEPVEEMIARSGKHQGQCFDESGRNLFFVRSERAGRFELRRAHRPDLASRFGPAEPVPGIEPAQNDTGDNDPSLADGGREIWMCRWLGRESMWDICFARRADLESPFGDLVFLGPEVNTAGREMDPVVTDGGLTLYFCRDERDHAFQLYRAVRSCPGAPWGEVRRVPGPVNDGDVRQPWISSDGSVMIFASSRSGEGGPDLFCALRDPPTDEWHRVATLGTAVNSPLGDLAPHFCEQDGHLYFCRGLKQEVLLYRVRCRLPGK